MVWQFPSFRSAWKPISKHGYQLPNLHLLFIHTVAILEHYSESLNIWYANMPTNSSSTMTHHQLRDIITYRAFNNPMTTLVVNRCDISWLVSSMPHNDDLDKNVSGLHSDPRITYVSEFSSDADYDYSWIQVPSIAYGAHTCTTLVPILMEMWHSPSVPTIFHRKLLTGVILRVSYCPLQVLATLCT